MRYTLLKFGHNKLIKPFINFAIVLLLNTPAISAERVLHIGTLYSSGSLTERILKTAYQRLNIKVEFVYLPAERSLHAVNEGSIDGEASRTAGLEQIYPNLIKVKIPIENISLSAYSKNSTIQIQGWQSLKPYHIAYLRGVKVIEKNLISFQKQSVSDIRQAFMMLEHDRVDIVIADNRQGITSKSEQIKKLTPAIYTFPVFHYLNKKHADLIPELEAVLYQMQKDGTFQRINQESE